MTKRMIVLFAYCSITIAYSYAQNVIYNNGTTKVFENGVVYSEGGFVEKDTDDDCTGLYSSDGKVFVKVCTTDNTSFHVANGTEFIAKNAFVSYTSRLTIYLPSSVKYIDPTSTGYDFGTDGFLRFRTYTDSSSAKSIKTTEEDGATEVARYTIQGMKIDEQQKGINIVQYSDNSAKKIVVK